jgi:hypothetical protein
MKNLIMRFLFLLPIVFNVQNSLVHADENKPTSMTFHFDGKVFSCVEGGALCRCKLFVHQEESYLAEMYYLTVEKFDPIAGKYSSLSTLKGQTRHTSQFSKDHKRCKEATQEPHCLFQ